MVGDKDPMSTPDQAEQDLPPWERPGAVRRDCDSHRGEWLAKLGAASLYCGSLSQSGLDEMPVS